MGRNVKAKKAIELVKKNPARRTTRADARFDDGAIRMLEARFFEAHRALVHGTVEAVIAMGGILRDARVKLEGEWTRWAEQRLFLDRSTARNYVAMAELARTSPALVERHKDLGVSRLYRIARLPPEARAALLATPGLTDLTDTEFAQVAAGSDEPGTRVVTGNMRGHGLRIKARSMAERLRASTAPRIDDPAMRASVKKELLDLAKAARELAMRIK